MQISNPVPDKTRQRYARLRLGLLGLLLVAPVGNANQPSADVLVTDGRFDTRSAQPENGLSPDAVVRIQMDALGSNASWGDDAGIEVAFRFASPANQRMTGPLERFVQLLKNPLYAPMLNHNSVEFAPSRDAQGKAWVPVRLTSADGGKAGYLFILGRQDGNPCECWMTESVQRIPLGDDGKVGKVGKDGTRLRGPAI